MGALSTLPRNGWLEPIAWPDGSSASLMDRLYNRLDGTYPNRWRAAFSGNNAIANWREAWAEAFAEEMLTVEEVKRGIAECRKRYDWPPSLPEFLKACRPPLDYESAFSEAVKQSRFREEGRDEWSSPAIFWASVDFGTFDLRNATYSAVNGRWAKCLDEAIRAVKDGTKPAQVPPRLDALPAPGCCGVLSEEAKRRLAEIADSLAKSKAFPR